MSNFEENIETDDGFINLHWDDILYTKILPCLSLEDLFTLRGLSSKYKLMIDSYFQQMKYMDLRQLSSACCIEPFKVHKFLIFETFVY